MSQRRMGIFSLYRQHHVGLAGFFVLCCLATALSSRVLMAPLYVHTLTQHLTDQFQSREARLVNALLLDQYDRAQSILVDKRFFPESTTKDLHIFSLDRYAQYGLGAHCQGTLQPQIWGLLCIAQGTIVAEFPLKAADNTLGHVQIQIPYAMHHWAPFRIALYGTGAVMGVIILVTFLSLRRFRHKVMLPIERAMDDIAAIDATHEVATAAADIPVRELHQLAMQLIKKQRELHEAQLATKTSMEIGRVATQVAHDLRSPLSSLEVAVRGLGEIAAVGEQRPGALGQYVQVLQLSAKRLAAIANGLLAKHQGEEEQPTIFSVHAVLDELIGEYQSRADCPAVGFVKQYHPHALELYGVPARVHRAVGNIVKNALEAMHNQGTLTATTGLQEACVTVAITDTGPGMSAATLAKVLQGGHTEGKVGGHGIGTQVVRETAEAFGGRIEGASVVGQGTTFRLILPVPSEAQRESTARDALALKELVIPVAGDDPVLVVDDEPSMREQWRVVLAAQQTAVRLCTCYEDVDAQHIGALLTHTAIVDYHFANSVHTGVEVVQLLQARGVTRLILCTAEYWKPSVQQQASALGVQLCPKPVPERIVVAREAGPVSASAGASPARVGLTGTGPSAIPCDCVLIDDDLLIHQIWTMVAKIVGKHLQTYAKAEAFFAVAAQIQKHTPIYVDAHLGDAVRGESVTKQLHDQGFETIYLATGYTAEQLPPLPWVKGIVRKDPPWSQ